VSSDRQTQQRMTASSEAGRAESDELLQLQADAEERRRAGAISRAAEREAQAKADAAAAAAALAAKAADDAARRAAVVAPPSAPAFGPVPASCAEYIGNVAIGCTLLLQWGFPLSEMPCLKLMWTKESGWNEKAYNAGSGATGIAQALPASKMAPYGADYLTNPATQIRWGLDYIKNRYKTPCGAWTFWQAHNWY